MQINSQNNSVNFTSVIPVKVFYDGKQALNKTNITRGCDRAIKAMCGPLEKNPNMRSELKYLERFDKDYSLYNAYYGFPQEGRVGSTVFNGDGYIFTGEEAKKIKEIGKEIGHELKKCKEKGVKESYELHCARDNYIREVRKFVGEKSRRIRDIFEQDGKMVEKPITMEIHMSEPKRQKYKLEHIFFV